MYALAEKLARALHWLTAGLLERHDDFAAARRRARRKEFAPEKRGERNHELEKFIDRWL
jgi:hypothetical protein